MAFRTRLFLTLLLATTGCGSPDRKPGKALEAYEVAVAGSGNEALAVFLRLAATEQFATRLDTSGAPLNVPPLVLSNGGATYSPHAAWGLGAYWVFSAGTLRRLSPHGTVLREEPLHPMYALAAALAVGDDSVLAVWVGDFGQLLALRVGSDGTPIDPTPLAIAPADVRRVAAAWDGTQFVVAFSDNSAVRLARLGEPGVKTLEQADPDLPSEVAVSRATGGVLVAWTAPPEPVGGQVDLVAQHFSNALEPIEGAPILIATTYLESGTPGGLELAAGASGHLIGWSSGDSTCDFSAAGLDESLSIHGITGAVASSHLGKCASFAPLGAGFVVVTTGTVSSRLIDWTPTGITLRPPTSIGIELAD